MGSRMGPFICGGMFNGLHLGLFYCRLSRGKLLCVFSLADSFCQHLLKCVHVSDVPMKTIGLLLASKIIKDAIRIITKW